MRKLLFSVLVVILLAVFTYLPGNGQGTESSAGWSMEVTGLVERPYNITLGELKNMTPRVVYADLYCVDSPNLPRKSGKWVGVPLRVLLERAGLKRNAYKVAFYADGGFTGGYTTDLRVSDVMGDADIIVAYEYNGKPITPRLVVPGRWGYKWIKGLTRVVVVDYNFLGTWERAGYSDDAYVENGSRPWR